MNMHRIHTLVLLGYGSSEPRGVGRTSQSIPAPGISHRETAPALGTADRTWKGSGEEVPQHPGTPGTPSVTSPGGHNLPLAGRGGAAPCPWRKGQVLVQPCLESQAGILVPPRSHSQQVQKLQSRHTLCNLRADGRCLKGSLKERQIKSNRNHRTN